MTKNSHIILGIDPGVATTGYAFIEEIGKKHTVIDYGIIKTVANTEFSQRLKFIHQDLNTLIKKFKPDAVAVEELFFAKNVKTAMMVGQARGVIVLTAIMHNLAVTDFTPLQIKQAVCGYGRADKHQVQNMVKNILKLKDIPKPDDAADALAIALTYLQARKFLEKTKN